MEDGKSCGSSGCKCPCHKLVGLSLIAIGTVFLLGNWGILPMGLVGTIWPLALIVLGLKKTCPNLCKCCPAAAK